ncbi:MAG: GNAT family N-acetyltransferase [Planctomycetota bacterium]|nr:GNAT family N-acetyltransferase [Planctomycetota bacterium]
MELPIAKQSYLPSPDALVRGVKRANAVLARAIAGEEALPGATAFFDPARPGVDLANFAADLHVPPESDAANVVAAVREHYRSHDLRCASLDSAESAWPAGLAGAAEAAGLRAVRWHVMLLQGYRPPARVNERLQIIPARAIYAQLPEIFGLFARLEHRADDAAAGLIARALVDQLDEQRLDLFVARLDGKPVGFAGVLGLGQMGVIQAAFTDPNCRGQSVGSTLMSHLLDHCGRALFEQVILERHEGCPSIPFYTGLGFTPVAEFVRYHTPHKVQ